MDQKKWIPTLLESSWENIFLPYKRRYKRLVRAAPAQISSRLEVKLGAGTSGFQDESISVRSCTCTHAGTGTYLEYPK